MRGLYHPRGPQDIPLEVEDLLGPVSQVLAAMDAERGQPGRPW